MISKVMPRSFGVSAAREVPLAPFFGCGSLLLLFSTGRYVG